MNSKKSMANPIAVGFAAGLTGASAFAATGDGGFTLLDAMDRRRMTSDREQRTLDRRQAQADRERARVQRIYEDAGARFQVLDSDDNGRICAAEAQSRPALDRAFDELGSDGHGRLTLGEYRGHRKNLLRESP